VNFNDYQQQALFTAVDMPRNDDLIHAAFGLISEAGEIADAIKAEMVYGKPVDQVNQREEVGDGLWFVALTCRLLTISMDQLVRDLPPDRTDAIGRCRYAIHLADAAAAIAMRIDSHVVGGRPLPLEAVRQELGRFLMHLRSLGTLAGVTLEQAAEGNLRKLAARFGGAGFDAERGLNRDKAAELAAVAGNAA